MKDTIFEEESCATGLTDAEDYQVIRAILLRTLLSPQNRISEVQTAPVPPQVQLGLVLRSLENDRSSIQKKEKSLG